jgi:LysM repeat protein
MALLSHIIQKMKQIPDKTRTIFSKLTELLSQAIRKTGPKANIGLKISLYTVKLVFFYAAFLAPYTANAGVFSFISSFLEGKEVDANVRPVTSQNMGVLQAPIGPSAAYSTGGGEIAMLDGSALMQESGVIGTQADIVEPKSTQISLYVVRKGDTLAQIADMYGVSVSTIIWANDITGSIKEGQELVILPISGVSHTVKKGDTIKSIAAKYAADADEILSYNNLKPSDTLSIGSLLIIPDGEVKAQIKSATKPAVSAPKSSIIASKEYFMRPIDIGVKTQGIHGYNGVDLAAPTGTPIHASAAGTVIVSRASGYNGGYGSYVVISHENGTQTLYAHMSKVLVTQGMMVTKGETIGLLGSTGKSTGPHVHFEIRGAANPF